MTSTIYREMSNSKIINCRIHNSIRLSKEAVSIINSAEFQRMRNIKQLGLCYYVYPSAIHTRFEHSIGVYYLAGIMVDKICQQYPDKLYDIPEISPTPVKLDYLLAESIKIAGLCHDLGHGPFSHIFDDVLLRNVDHPNKHHETRSCLITEMICKRELDGVLTKGHIEFIKSIIHPQEHHKGALYQIVSNSLNGIDVDKFDYLIRDASSIGKGISFDHMRLLSDFIIDENNNIAYPKQCSMDIFEMYYSRYTMHKKVYHHKTVKIMEEMLKDLFLLIDPVLKISQTIDNMEEFCKITDDTIFNYLNLSTDSRIQHLIEFKLKGNDYIAFKKASDIYQNIKTRKLYKRLIYTSDAPNSEDFLKNILDYILTKHPEYTSEDFIISNTKIGFVSGDANPFTSIYFYDKKEDSKTFTKEKEDVSGLLMGRTREMQQCLICKNKVSFQTIVKEIKDYIKSNPKLANISYNT